MKEFDFVGTFHGIEQELDNYRMSTKNHGDFGSEILETDVMDIQAYTATPDMDTSLTDDQINEIDDKHKIREKTTMEKSTSQDYEKE